MLFCLRKSIGLKNGEAEKVFFEAHWILLMMRRLDGFWIVGNKEVI